MNRISFAGKIPDFTGKKVNKCFEIIIPAKTDNSRRLVTENFSHGFSWGEIPVIPPLCEYSIEGHNPEDIHVLIEQALLGLKEPDIITDVENEGIRHASLQAVEFINSDWANKDCVLAALGNLLVSYIGLYIGEKKKLSPVTEQIRAELESHVSDPLFSVESCLKNLPLNYDYLRKLFKKELGATPHEYLLHARMELARGLISSGISNTYSNYSVSQIAEACGFSDPLYFSRVFKNYFGVSPSDYADKK